MSLSSCPTRKNGTVLLKFLCNLQKSSPVACPYPSRPPSHNTASKNRPMAQLPVCLFCPFHPGHSTQLSEAREATGCLHLKSPCTSLHTSSSQPPPWSRPPGVHCLTPLLQVRPQMYTLPPWLFEATTVTCLQPSNRPQSLPCL